MFGCCRTALFHAFFGSWCTRAQESRTPVKSSLEIVFPGLGHIHVFGMYASVVDSSWVCDAEASWLSRRSVYFVTLIRCLVNVKKCRDVKGTYTLRNSVDRVA